MWSLACIPRICLTNHSAQILSKYHMALQQIYSAASAVLTGLDPASMSNPRTAEDLLLAHLTFKPLVKAAVWLWPRILKNAHDFGKLQSWV